MLRNFIGRKIEHKRVVICLVTWIASLTCRTSLKCVIKQYNVLVILVSTVALMFAN